ncbi:phage portal protein [Rosistilla oblonga]|uniref:Phage portal protein n=1 Tax=Rosistilla oblonga TaxID=2527990 RepID=A0A518ITU3_9BACT|nr:phage portal protein [Rosistilla oblonga]QDV56506.1 Phage portal protein [Rosistilla oblonga]
MTAGVYDALSCFDIYHSTEQRSAAGGGAGWDVFATGDTSDAGETVTATKALGYAPVYQAVSRISGDVAKLPLGIYKRVKGGKELQRNHAVFPIIQLMGRANPSVSAFKFWRRLMAQALLWNNGWAWIERSASGRPIGLYNLLSDRTGYGRDKKTGQLCVHTEVGGKLWQLLPDDVIHVEGVSIDCEAGESILRLFRHDFGLALAARKFKSKFFKGNANLGGILMVPPGSNPDNVRKVRNKLDAKMSGESNESFKTLVLRDGYKWLGTQVDPQKASVSSIDEDGIRSVAQMYNLDPSLFGLKSSVSYNSREMAKQDYHESALSPWLVGIKSECQLKLLSDAEREADTHLIDYNINAMQWTDAKTRAEIASKGIQSGRYSPNETRSWENMNAYDGGDVWYQPLHLATVGKSADDEYEGEPDEDPETDDTERSLHRTLMVETLTRMHGRLHGQARKHADYASNMAANRSICESMLSTPAAIARVNVASVLDAYDTWMRDADDNWDAVRVSIPKFVEALLK